MPRSQWAAGARGLASGVLAEELRRELRQIVAPVAPHVTLFRWREAMSAIVLDGEGQVRPQEAVDRIEILVGLRPPDEGSVRVCGLDPTRESEELKQRIDNLRVTLDRLGDHGESETGDWVGGTIRRLHEN